jgi:hypothetical protein
MTALKQINASKMLQLVKIVSCCLESKRTAQPSDVMLSTKSLHVSHSSYMQPSRHEYQVLNWAHVFYNSLSTLVITRRRTDDDPREVMCEEKSASFIKQRNTHGIGSIIA